MLHVIFQSQVTAQAAMAGGQMQQQQQTQQNPQQLQQQLAGGNQQSGVTQNMVSKSFLGPLHVVNIFLFLLAYVSVTCQYQLESYNILEHSKVFFMLGKKH